MQVIKFLADTNAVSDYFRPGTPIPEWMNKHQGEIGISTFSLAEIRRGIELKGNTKGRWELERMFKFVLEDYREAIFVFDEAAALEWGVMTAKNKNPVSITDSFIAAIARSCDLTVVTRNAKDFPDCKTINPWPR